MSAESDGTQFTLLGRIEQLRHVLTDDDGSLSPLHPARSDAAQ